MICSQKVGRRAPVHANDLQEPGVEPRRQQVAKVPVDGFELALLVLELQQALAHAQDRGGAAGRAVEPSQQLLPRRFGGNAQLREVGGRLQGGIGVRRREDSHWIGRELGKQRREELRLAPLVQCRIQIQRDPGQRHAGSLTAFGQQFPAADNEAPQLEPVGRNGGGAFRTDSNMRRARVEMAAGGVEKQPGLARGGPMRTDTSVDHKALCRGTVRGRRPGSTWQVGMGNEPALGSVPSRFGRTPASTT